jgi:glucose-6-phosphate-specific signal transduction histidine kinase
MQGMDQKTAMNPNPRQPAYVRALTRLFESRERQFWVLQSAGWALYFAAAWVSAMTYDKPTPYYNLILGAAVSGFLLTLPLRYVYRRLWTRSPAALIVTTLLVSYLVGLAWAVVKNLIYWEIFKPEYTPDHWNSYFSGAVSGTYVILCWSGLYFGIKYYKGLQEERQRALKAGAMAHEAQLKMLRYQLNPHFLFNTLNAISTLILERDNQTANLAVTRLSDFLRYTLHNDPMQKSSLDQELKSLDLYLEIEKVRFQERLRVTFDIGERARKALVPSLITQPIIENAIKYAVAPREEGGSLLISAHVVNDRLIIEIADDGPGLDGEPRSSNGGGVGLRNTRERLHQMYGDGFTLELGRARPNGLRVIMAFPYET